MIWFYRLLFLPALLLALPYYLLRMWRRGGYRKDFQHRLGRFRRLPKPETGKQRIWLQAVSVGEVHAIGPLIQALNATGQIEIVLTTTTSTGYAEAKKRYAHRVFSIGIFPLDFWLFSRLAWKRIQPDAIILTESELWPEHLHRAQKRSIPAYLVNARMSDRSFGRYILAPQLTRRLFRKFSGIYAASETDKSRFDRLGARTEALHFFGSIKLDVPLPPLLSASEKSELIQSLGFEAPTSEAPFIILGSSTWPGEESALVDIINNLIQEGKDCHLLLVPRHAERGTEIAEVLKQQKLPWHQRSSGTSPEVAVRIQLADTTGELSTLTQLADLAFIGKSLTPNHGGQSPIDAAGLGIPLILGPHMSNFRDISESLLHTGAAERVYDQRSLERTISELIQNGRKRESMSEAGKAWHSKSLGSSERIAKSIFTELNRVP